MKWSHFPILVTCWYIQPQHVISPTLPIPEVLGSSRDITYHWPGSICCILVDKGKFWWMEPGERSWGQIYQVAKSVLEAMYTELWPIYVSPPSHNFSPTSKMSMMLPAEALVFFMLRKQHNCLCFHFQVLPQSCSDFTLFSMLRFFSSSASKAIPVLFASLSQFHQIWFIFTVHRSKQYYNPASQNISYLCFILKRWFFTKEITCCGFLKTIHQNHYYSRKEQESRGTLGTNKI